jgi:hypothetical protein
MMSLRFCAMFREVGPKDVLEDRRKFVRSGAQVRTI